MPVFCYQICFFAVLIFSCKPTETNPEKRKSQEKATFHPADSVSKIHEFSLDYLMGKFDPAKDSQFIEIPKHFANRAGMFCRKDVFAAFQKMHAAAKTEGIDLVILSATRNFAAQKEIWEAKWNGTRKIENGKDASKAYPDPADRAKKILEWSSMPGSSRHHWGTDMDLNDLENEYFESGKGKKVYDWLKNNAPEFGFCQPYTQKGPERPNGYNEEKWHWSYVPVAKELILLAREKLKNDLITGFEGSETAEVIDIVNNYVLGINKECLDQ